MFLSLLFLLYSCTCKYLQSVLFIIELAIEYRDQKALPTSDKSRTGRKSIAFYAAPSPQKKGAPINSECFPTVYQKLHLKIFKPDSLCSISNEYLYLGAEDHSGIMFRFVFRGVESRRKESQIYVVDIGLANRVRCWDPSLATSL